VLVIVKPETVVAWHRAGFRLFWRIRSRANKGRPQTDVELRRLIKRMASENPTYVKWADMWSGVGVAADTL
jgi:hypothetical protein